MYNQHFTSRRLLESRVGNLFRNDNLTRTMSPKNEDKYLKWIRRPSLSSCYRCYYAAQQQSKRHRREARTTWEKGAIYYEQEALEVTILQHLSGLVQQSFPAAPDYSTRWRRQSKRSQNTQK